MGRYIPCRPLAALLAGGVLLVTAATTLAAGGSIELNLKGGRNQERTACSERHHYHVYRRGGTLKMEGYVSPAPASANGTWLVKIKVKQCKGRRFVPIWQAHTRGSSVVLNGATLGHFHMTYRMRRTGYFFARAYYYGSQPRIRSEEEHFRVTR